MTDHWVKEMEVFRPDLDERIKQEDAERAYLLANPPPVKEESPPDVVDLLVTEIERRAARKRIEEADKHRKEQQQKTDDSLKEHLERMDKIIEDQRRFVGVFG